MFCRFITSMNNVTIKRWLLTQSYKCESLWNERLKSIDCKLSANELNISLQASLNNDVPISALDFDILMNKVNEVDIINLDYIDTLIRSFRKTQESVKAYESSSHALIKNLIDLDEPFHAFNLISDRQNTGIFVDEVSANLLIDKFVTTNNWEKAFLTSAEWLLQDNLHLSKLCVSMSLLTCLHFWKDNLWQFKPPVVAVSDQVEYVAVRYLKPNSFDDHFDLSSDKFRRRLLGKCFCMVADYLDLEANSEMRYLKMNIKLLGLALHEKLGDLIVHLEQCLSMDDVKLNNSLITEIEELIKTSEKTDLQNPVSHPTHSDVEIEQIIKKYQDIVTQLRAKHSAVEDSDFVDFALKLIETKIQEHSEQESGLVRHKYEAFNEYREKMFEKTKQKLVNQSVLEQSKKKLLDLMEQEEQIKYFELIPEIMYKSWLAKRTLKEKAFSMEKDEQENLENIKKKEKKRFVVQHTLE